MFFPRAFLAALAALAVAQALVIAVLLFRDRPARHIAHPDDRVPTCETPRSPRAFDGEPCLPLVPSLAPTTPTLRA